MKVIYVAGAYRAKTIHGVLSNIRRAEAVAAKVWEAGYVALCPHLNSAFFDGITSDDNFLAGTLELLRRSDGLVLVPGWGESKGTHGELDYCRFHNIPIYKNVEELILLGRPAHANVDDIIAHHTTRNPETSKNDTVADMACGCALCNE